jgi:hypothetical protein
MSKQRRGGGNKWTFVESTRFQKARGKYLSDVEFEALRELIPRHPGSWVSLKGGPGLFGLHWGRATPVTIVFMTAPDAQKVYLIDIEPGKHDSVTKEVKEQLPDMVVQFGKAGIKVAVYEGAKGLVRWLREQDWEDWL